ncbi:group II intron reverse transcriptase/maturase [Actinomadura luteofluorescens]|uniref:group II intron reverse transcriptase/maturase n=1 Tax=Actinomadura luteofluorescens TaxID=46163 RepID=UPI0030CA5EA5
MASEPRGKLDAETANGPEGLQIPEQGRPDLDESSEWGRIDWSEQEKQVRRLRQRIFKAVQEGDLAKARNLQKLMLRSQANTLVSVRQVTQRNAGRRTAGVDGEVALTHQARMRMARRVHRSRQDWRPRPIRRVHIPKAGNPARMRPLGIPVLMDRCHQARVRNALEPEWEARFEAKSYGFRPGRGCHDAIEAIYETCKSKTAARLWALDADLAAAFDRIDHEKLMEAIGLFPAREMVREWLQAGVFEAGRGFAPTEEGTPQGGVISPLLLNVAVHGLETVAGARYRTTGPKAGRSYPDSPVVVRYADDLVVLCHTRHEAVLIKERLARWLGGRGLSFNEDKTRIVHVAEGFDFLGCNVRRYGSKLLIKPSKAAVQRIRSRLAFEMRRLRGANAKAVIAALNPVIRGWAAYYRPVVSSKVFEDLDTHVWRLTYKWATHSHQNKPKSWIIPRYYGQFNKFRNDRWVFGDLESGAYLVMFRWTEIKRHVMVRGWASPDDPLLAEYWAHRRRRSKPPLDRYTIRLLDEQNALCPMCGDYLLTAEQPPQSPQQWESWWQQVTRRAIAASYLLIVDAPESGRHDARTRLVHTHCHRSWLYSRRRGKTQRDPKPPLGSA